MKKPKTEQGTKLCITVTKSGIKFYGNQQAFKSLARWLTWIADSDEREHYECHLPWHFETYESLDDKALRNVWILFDKATSPIFNKPNNDGDSQSTFVTFMAVENDDLLKLSQFKESGLLPDDWINQNDEG